MSIPPIIHVHVYTQVPRADVYGLLLPDKIHKTSNSTTHLPSSTLTTTTIVPTSNPDHTQSVLTETNENQFPGEGVDDSLPNAEHTGPVVKRRSSTGNKKYRNRKSSLYTELTEPTQQDSEIGGVSIAPVPNMNVQILSVSPEQSESRRGKLSDLVEQFEQKETESEVTERGMDGKGKRRKPSNKAFEMFERKGIVIRMVRYMYIVYLTCRTCSKLESNLHAYTCNA